MDRHPTLYIFLVMKNMYHLPDVIYFSLWRNLLTSGARVRRQCKSQLCDIFHQHLIRANIYTLTVTLYFSFQQYFISKLFIQVARSKCQTVGFLLVHFPLWILIFPLHVPIEKKMSRGEIRGIILFPKRLGDPRPIF